MHSLAIALSLLLLSVSGAASAASPSDKDSLIDLEHKRSAAIAAHDKTFLNGIYTDDFQGVTALGFQVDKAALMVVFSRDNPNTRFTLDEIEPRVFADTAIVTGRLTGRDENGAITSLSAQRRKVAARRRPRHTDTAAAPKLS